MFKIVLLFAHQIGIIDTLIDFAYKMLGVLIDFIQEFIGRFF